MKNSRNSLNKYRDKVKIGDYPTYCDTCGSRMWYSQSKVLGKYTGKGNALVCKDCVDLPAHSLIPFKITPEKTARVTGGSALPAVTTAPTINFDTSPPTLEE